MKTDPTDNGGLFVGRRPGTAPIKYRALPERGSAARVRVDRLLAGALLAAMAFISLCFWGPVPAGSLWLASQIQYVTGSVTLGIFVGFAVMLAVLLVGLMILRRIDLAWILVRRAAGYDQRAGVLGKVFGITAAVGVVCFSVWLLIIAGPGASLAPTG